MHTECNLSIVHTVALPILTDCQLAGYGVDGINRMKGVWYEKFNHRHDINRIGIWMDGLYESERVTGTNAESTSRPD